MHKDRMKVKLCLVGDRAVGKTSLVHRYVLNQFSERYIQTMGSRVSKKVVMLPLELRRKTMRLDMTLWDITGDRTLTELSKEAYFHGARGLLAVCDVTRRSTVRSLDYWIEDALQLAGDLPIYIIANKKDLIGRMEVTQDDVLDLGRAFSSPYLMTSAKTGANVERAFEFLAKRIVEKELGPDIGFLVEERFGFIENPRTRICESI